MTGTGAAVGPTEAGPLRIELRSVNGRSLQLKQRLCREVAAFESVFEDELRRAIGRGTVTLVVERESRNAGLPDKRALEAMVTELRTLARDLGLRD